MRNKVSLCALVALFCLCLCICVGSAFSSFKQAVEGADSAHVAAFAIDASVDPEAQEDIAVTQSGEHKIGSLSVTNMQNQVVGDVNEKYKVILNSVTQLPEETTLCLKTAGGKTVYQAVVNKDRTQFSFESDDFSFAYGSEEKHQYDVYIVWEGMTLPESIDVNVKATVIGEQID